MSLLKELLEAYRTMRREGTDIPLKVKSKVKPEEHQIRKILIDPPAWVLLVKREGNLWVGVALTDWVELSRTEKSFPYLFTREATLVPLPSFLYLSEEFLENHTKAVAKANRDITDKVLEYVKNTRLPREGIYKEFLSEEIPRLEKLSLDEILKNIEKEEKLAETGIKVLVISSALKKALEHKYTRVPFAKTHQRTFRGSNWLGYLDNGKLKIQILENTTGKKVRIKLGGEIIYEGEGVDELILENIPELPDYSVLERELEVEVA